MGRSGRNRQLSSPLVGQTAVGPALHELDDPLLGHAILTPLDEDGDGGAETVAPRAHLVAAGDQVSLHDLSLHSREGTSIGAPSRG